MFKRLIVLISFLAILLAPALAFGAVPARAQGNGPIVYTLTARGAVTPAMAEYIERGLQIARQSNAQALIVELDTPGGSLDVMQRIVEDFRASSVPVVVYVYPHGAMAGSAGTLITVAAQASAMAPGTIIGAASPVGPSGQDLSQTESAKLKNAMDSLAASLTAGRGQKATTMAQQAIDSAQAYTYQQAKDGGLIDFVATDLNDLLRQLDGFKVTVNGNPVTLHVAGAQVQDIPISLVEQLLTMLTDPNLVFILLQVGVLAVLIEISSPGGWVAGTIGVTCLALATYGLGILPVNWFGLVFLGMAFVLFFLDIKSPTHGALTLAGTISLILGALVLFNSPGTPSEFRVSPWLVIVTSILMAAMFGVIVSFAVRVQKRPVQTGRENIVGRLGTVRRDLHPQGTVQVNGELWTAQLIEGPDALPAGSKIQVVAVDGLHLLVRPANGHLP
jgi:membrane-bound serine protease (ClpP class)